MAERISKEDAARLKGELQRPPAPETDEGPSPETGVPEEALEILLTSSAEVLETAQGGFTISPMMMGQIAEFIAVAHKVLPMIRSGLSGNGEINLSNLLAADNAGVFRAVAIGCTPVVDDDVEFSTNIVSNLRRLKHLPPNDFIKIATKVILVNLDFFVRTLPAALGIAEKSVFAAIKRMAADGPYKSSALSQPGILTKQ